MEPEFQQSNGNSNLGPLYEWLYDTGGWKPNMAAVELYNY